MTQVLPPEEQVHRVERSRLFERFSYIALGFCLIVIGVLIFWGVYPYDVLDIKNPPVPTNPKQIHAAQLVFLKTNFCKLTNHKGTVQMYLVLETKEILLPVFTDESKKRCEVVDFPFLVPKDLEKGRAHVRFEIVYHVNPIRTVTEVFSSQEFEILP